MMEIKETDVFHLLAASGPFAEDARKLMLFGQFVGSWDLESTWYEQGEGQRKGKGERHVAWMQPHGGEFVQLIGRKVGDRIVQEGAGPDPKRPERWSYTNITQDGFVWLGEVSFDEGATWLLEQEMRAIRRPGPSSR